MLKGVRTSFKVSPDETKFDMSKNVKISELCPSTVLLGQISLHNQTSVVQLQKYFLKIFPVFLVSPQIVRNVVALTHFLQDVPRVEKTLQYVNT